jgi:hypothetical protein
VGRALALTAPTPRAFGVAFGGGTAASMRAPLTWSGVQLGLTERMCAAAPATTGPRTRCPTSTPTVITNGSLAGEYLTPLAAVGLP